MNAREPTESWKAALVRLAGRYPDACVLRDGAAPAELADLQQHVGPRLLAAEPALVQALQFSNGFSVGPFEFYKASGVGMATVTFKTLYVGDLSPAFRKRACFFGGTSPLLDVGVVLGSEGAAHVGCVTDSGYDQSHAIPLASSLPTFLRILLTAAEEGLSRGESGAVPALSTWPPDLEWWYQRDPALAAGLADPRGGDLREAGPYSDLVAKAATGTLA